MPQQSSPLFSGFNQDDEAMVRLPQAFFTQLLPHIKTQHPLCLLLYLFWQAERQQNQVHYFRWDDLLSDPALIVMMDDVDGLKQALDGLVDLGAVLKAELEWLDEVYYFLNTPQGRAGVEGIEKGTWQETPIERQPIHLVEEQPNIFALYEQNIGVITPMMAEILKEDEATYPAAWIEEAIRIAVTRNVRTWNYVQGILKRWHKEGREDEQNRRDDSQDPERYRKSWLKR
jgi:DNA replication protein